MGFIMSKSLQPSYFNDHTITEIGVDEAGKGPLFGRVYAAAVILPKDSETFEYDKMKDSKKFSSKIKRESVAEYIKENAISWGVGYADEKYIEKHNIRQATFHAMHTAIKPLVNDYKHDNLYLLIDGNDFKPFTYFDEKMKCVPDLCIEKGDNKLCAIAAASILAKVAHDKYIENICIEYPGLNECYDLCSNKGYGTAKHIAGIEKHGVSEWHRKTYNRCKNFPVLDFKRGEIPPKPPF